VCDRGGQVVPFHGGHVDLGEAGKRLERGAGPVDPESIERQGIAAIVQGMTGRDEVRVAAGFGR
jgi:hypothetical protein